MGRTKFLCVKTVHILGKFMVNLDTYTYYKKKSQSF